MHGIRKSIEAKIKRPEAQQEPFGTFYHLEKLPNKAFLMYKYITF